jgi:hypothetical protein
MRRFLLAVLVLNVLVSCSKKEGPPTPPVVIPDVIDGVITEITVTPLDITTPDKGTFLVTANNTVYQVDFNTTGQPQSNAVITFASDTILTEDSREFANLGKDAIAYQPIAENTVTVSFHDGRKVAGSFYPLTSFGGEFGEQLIAQWRDVADPPKPNQKAKDDVREFVSRYEDKDGAGPGADPAYLIVTVTKR